MRKIAAGAGVSAWWDEVEALLQLLPQGEGRIGLAGALASLASIGERLAGEGLWEREDGRALARFVEEMRLAADQAGALIDPGELAAMLRDAMAEVAVRPPYGGHPRVAIYGLLESRMARADLMICAGLNEGSWPAAPRPPIFGPSKPSRILTGASTPPFHDRPPLFC